MHFTTRQSRAQAMQWADIDLVEQCQRGDEHAWYAVVEKYEGLVCAALRRYRLSPQDTADLLQEVWVDLHSDLKSLRTGELAGWLFSVATHKCYHWKRRRQRKPQEQLNPSSQEPAAKDQLVPDWLEETERDRVIREIVADLPERDQRMVEMLFYQDPPTPYAEVARRLGLAEGSIGFMRANCLRKIRETLERRGFATKSEACANCRSLFCAHSRCDKRWSKTPQPPITIPVRTRRQNRRVNVPAFEMAS